MTNEQRVFPNKLRLIVNSTDSPVACVLVRVETGVCHEKKKDEGITAILEQLLLCGTKSYPTKSNLESAIESIGGKLSTYASFDSVKIVLKCLPENITKAVEIVSEIVFDSVFAETDIKIIKKRIEKLRHGQAESPFLLGYDNLREIMFSGTGYDKNILGRKSSLSSLTTVDVKKYWQKALCPENILVNIAGNVDAEDMYDTIVQSFYGKSIKTSGKKTKDIPKFTNITNTRFVIDTKRINQSRILIGYQTDGITDKNYYATGLACQILNKKIQEIFSTKDFVYAADSHLNSYQNNGLFYIRLAVDNENVNEAVDTLASEMLNIVDNGLSNEDFIAQKNIYKTRFVSLLENAEEICKVSSKYSKYFGYTFDDKLECKKINNITQSDCIIQLKQLFEQQPFISVVGSSTIDEKLYLKFYNKIRR